MKLKEKILQSFESLFLAMFMVWTLGITVALLNPSAAREHHGTVEIYSLTAVGDETTGA